MDGYLNVLKPPGLTSHDVVGRIRQLTGQRRVGHTGTLDPAAVGVMPVAIGRATKTVSSPVWDAKTYWADVCFGSATDTDDADGQIVQEAQVPDVDLHQIVTALGAFVGTIQQRPPAYSAVHVGGQRAYRAARRGEAIETPVRQVQVEAISIASWASPVLSLRIQCSTGTYIRSIARDLGRSLGTVAHLAALVRLRVGPFGIADAADPLHLEALGSVGAISTILWPVDVAWTRRSAIVEGPPRSLDFHYGRHWPAAIQVADSRPDAWNDRTPDQDDSATIVRVYTTEGSLLGSARLTDGQFWQPELGLPIDPPAFSD